MHSFHYSTATHLTPLVGQRMRYMPMRDLSAAKGNYLMHYPDQRHEGPGQIGCRFAETGISCELIGPKQELSSRVNFLTVGNAWFPSR